MTATDVMTPAEFQRWLITAEPIERVTYHVGYLIVDRERRPMLNALANAVWDAQAGGFVELTQFRFGAQLYAYLATRTQELVG